MAEDDMRPRDWLLSLGYIEEDDIIQLLARELKMEFITDLVVNPEMLHVLSRRSAEERRMIPLDCKGHTLRFAVADPFDVEALDHMREVAGNLHLNARFVLAREDQIWDAILKYYPDGAG